MIVFLLLLLLLQSGDDLQQARRLGKAYYEESNYRSAVEQFQKVVRAQPGRSTFEDHLNLGLAYVGLPDEAAALAALETARQMRPNAPAPLYALGILHKRQGRFREALDFLERAQKNGGDDMATLFNIGAVLMAMGRTEDALAAFEKLLARGPDFGPGFYIAAEYRVSRLLQRLGRTEDAQHTLKRWEARKKSMKEPNDSPTMLELGPLASPQIPAEAMPPRSDAVAPVFSSAVAHPIKPLSRTLVFDFDVDGDVDRLVIPVSCGLPRLERNNGNGTHTDVTAAAGIKPPKPVCAAAAADFDADGDPDFVVAGRDGAWLFSNLRGGKFEQQSPFGSTAATEVAVGDLDGDGRFDLAFGSPQQFTLWWNRGAQFANVDGARAPFTLADLNGDGLLDIASAGEKKLDFWLNLGGRKFQPHAGPVLPAAVTVLDFAYQADGRLLLLAAGRSGSGWKFERTAPQGRWLRLTFEGVRSNKEGVGATVEVKAGNFYTRALVGTEPLTIETGQLARVDVVRVTWPNGIVQNVIETATNREVRISEQDRLASSCPLLYLWNGERFVFFAEVLSSTPLGEPDGRGGFILPGSGERVFLPGEKVIVRDRRYVFQLTEELREVVYMDSARLIALDAPPGARAFVDEAYRGAPIAMPPVALSNVTRLATHTDPDRPKEDSLPGLMEKHALYFDLPGDANFVVLRGWTYWMDSNIATAASQDPARAALFPVLESQQPDGSWKAIIEDLGVPSGAGRHVLADLRGRARARALLRIVTNLRVFWDEVLAGSYAGTPRRSVALAATANLQYRGFSVPVISPTRSAPDFYDYSRLLVEPPWNAIPGRYTKYGDVRGLLLGDDDRLVILGAGDELTVEFAPGELPPLSAGWRRDFVLDLSGWAKAGETNTARSDTVDPLPFRAMKQYPYHSRRQSTGQQRWLTRRPMPLLAPLAPP